MPIPVTCPGCKASFNVSDKFAGKQGPCPKCKTVISIPKLDAAAKKQEEVKIHAPEETATVGGGKSKTGRPTLNPIFRRDLRLTPVMGGSVVAAILVLFAAAYFVGELVMSPYPLTGDQQLVPDLKSAYDAQIFRAYILRAMALTIVAVPIVWAGYLILRDDELEPFRGRSLLVRSSICIVAYLLLWGIYALLPDDYTTAWYMWMVLGPPFLLAGFVTAYLCFDFDPTSAIVHFLFFVVVTLLLGMTAGLTMPWYEEPRTLPPTYTVEGGGELPLYDESGRPINDAAKKLDAEQKKLKPTGTAAATGS